MRSRNADTAEKVKALTDKLETGVKAVFESEQYKAYMKAMAKFHRYSFNNVMTYAQALRRLCMGTAE